MNIPQTKPNNNLFSSGPCAKRPGWDLNNFNLDTAGRSHRSKIGKARLAELIEKSAKLLNLPQGYKIGIVAGSDTGAFEMAIWNLIGPNGVDALAWDAFGLDWVKDIDGQLKIDDLRIFKADYGQLPDLKAIDSNRDIVFVYNGTTSGVCVPNLDWIKDDRKGLTICDATSAVFAMDIDWSKIDVATYSWQKAMGSEGAHGMLILSPRAIERLEKNPPKRALPKIFRMLKNGKLNEAIFKGATINTPSMLCVEDALDVLNWMEKIGGLSATISRSQANLTAVAAWVKNSKNFAFLAEDESTISSTSICLKIDSEFYHDLEEESQVKFAKQIAKILEEEGVALDVGSYRDAPAGIRIWGGSTIETSDIEALLPWLDYAYEAAKSQVSAAA